MPVFSSYFIRLRLVFVCAAVYGVIKNNISILLVCAAFGIKNASWTYSVVSYILGHQNSLGPRSDRQCPHALKFTAAAGLGLGRYDTIQEAILTCAQKLT